MIYIIIFILLKYSNCPCHEKFSFGEEWRHDTYLRSEAVWNLRVNLQPSDTWMVDINTVFLQLDESQVEKKTSGDKHKHTNVLQFWACDSDVDPALSHS